MSTLAEEKRLHNHLRTQLDQLKAIDAGTLDRVDVLGQQLSFHEGQPYFQRTLRLFRELAATNLDGLPWQNLQSLAQAAERANDFFSKIQNFSVATHQQNPLKAREVLIAQIREDYHGWFNEIAPIIAYSMRKGTDFERLEREAREQLSSIKQISTELRERTEKIVAEAQGARDKARDAVQRVGVAQHTIHFQSEAERHETDAGKWLKAVKWFAGRLPCFLLLIFGLSSISDLSISQLPKRFSWP